MLGTGAWIVMVGRGGARTENGLGDTTGPSGRGIPELRIPGGTMLGTGTGSVGVGA